MKIVIAPDKFKGTLDATSVAHALAAGIASVIPHADILTAPMADGGEGTVDALLAVVGGVRHNVVVTGPLGEPVKAGFAVLSDSSAAIEMAQASGLVLVPPDKRDPLITTTYGTGELIDMALDTGTKRIVIGIGGSATVDAGVGCAQALGVKLLKADGSPIGFGGGELIKISAIDVSALDPRVWGTEFLVAVDVDNPLYGPLGAAHAFAPQKGADAQTVFALEQGAIHFAHIVKRDLDIDVSELPGGGAAGGLGASLVALLGARLVPGAQLIGESLKLTEKVEEAALVITGEGQLDGQSAHGKAPAYVVQLAREAGVPVAVVVGRLGSGYEVFQRNGPVRIVALADIAPSLDAAMHDPARYLEQAGKELAAALLA
ncbi:MAG TPA: glycerate kinase [Candidatus Aquicultor sp.]|jgi:glycerate kinase